MDTKKNRKSPTSGRKPHQKLKAYLIYEYLLKYSDEEHTYSANDLVAILKEDYGIAAERRSIYRDIDEINKINLMIEDDLSADEADKELDEDSKIIVYDSTDKGFYVRQRKYELNDIRLLCECVYATKFISPRQSEFLTEILSGLVSEHQAEKIKHDVHVFGRNKTSNGKIIEYIDKINEAMSIRIDGQKHIPEKIKFRYQYHTLDNVKETVSRKKGEYYTVDPFALVINDGNYYLLGHNGKRITTYRLDRMKDIKRTNIPREHEDEYAKLDFATFTRRVFSMYRGKEKRVTIRFINTLLDTALEKFGTKNVVYSKVDDTHFKVTADVEVSDQFFGWVLGFGKRAKILFPYDVVDEFKEYLDKVRSIYEDE